MITTFNFQSNAIRTLEVNGELLFVAADVAACLGLAVYKGSYSSHWSQFTADEKRTFTRAEVRKFDHGYLLELFGKQAPTMTLLTESGMYRLVLRSDKPQAKIFQDWVTREVLPSIRKTGAYVVGQPSVQTNDQLTVMLQQAKLVTGALEQMVSLMAMQQQTHSH